MTDRIRTITVVLDADYRDDCVEPIMHALRMVKGVTNVKMGPPSTDFVARSAVRTELWKALHDAMHDVLYGEGT